jgi:hypothetical protein
MAIVGGKNGASSRFRHGRGDGENEPRRGGSGDDEAYGVGMRTMMDRLAAGPGTTFTPNVVDNPPMVAVMVAVPSLPVHTTPSDTPSAFGLIV